MYEEMMGRGLMSIIDTMRYEEQGMIQCIRNKEKLNHGINTAVYRKTD